MASAMQRAGRAKIVSLDEAADAWPLFRKQSHKVLEFYNLESPEKMETYPIFAQ